MTQEFFHGNRLIGNDDECKVAKWKKYHFYSLQDTAPALITSQNTFILSFNFKPKIIQNVQELVRWKNLVKVKIGIFAKTKNIFEVQIRLQK